MTSFPIPSGVTTTGSEPSTPGTKKDATDFSLEDLMVAQSLLPKKRNDKRHKAMRLLVAGRLRVLRVEGELVVAECRGDSGAVYKLGHDPRKKQWRCTCPARTDCSHLNALWAVVSLEKS
jgi:uncharacterized Zn finger protein